MTSLRKLGSSDLEVFPLALGGNVFGWTADRDRSFAVLDAYTAAGGDFVDTADSYSAWVDGDGGGESATVLGQWFAARGTVSDVVLATKVSQHPEYPGLSAANIKAAADASLRRLGTDHIDLYYTHFDKPEVPVEEIIGALDDLVKAGKVRHIAASNISAERLAEYLAAPTARASPGTSPSSRTTTWSPATPTRASCATSPSRPVSPPCRTTPSRPTTYTGKYRPGTEVDSPRAGGAAKHLETERAARCWPRWTRSPRPTTLPSPRSPSHGSPPSRRWRRRSPPRARWSSCRPCWAWPG
ncbi:Aldo/keto reductase OS=Streptomyces tendae OX=1932 GN=GUR47_22195 PE=4 SV=1 [Streptomyces tendae]